MWNSLRSLRILSVTSLAVKVGEVKMKLSSSIFSNSAFKASKAYIEKHEAAILSRDLGFSVALRSSPSNRVMLSISSMFLFPLPSVDRRIRRGFQAVLLRVGQNQHLDHGRDGSVFQCHRQPQQLLNVC